MLALPPQKKNNKKKPQPTNKTQNQQNIKNQQTSNKKTKTKNPQTPIKNISPNQGKNFMISARLRDSSGADIWHSPASCSHGQPILMSSRETLDLGNLQWMMSCSPEPFQTSSAPKNRFTSIRHVLTPTPAVWDFFLLIFFLQWTGSLKRWEKLSSCDAVIKCILWELPSWQKCGQIIYCL